MRTLICFANAVGVVLVIAGIAVVFIDQGIGDLRSWGSGLAIGLGMGLLTLCRAEADLLRRTEIQRRNGRRQRRRTSHEPDMTLHSH